MFDSAPRARKRFGQHFLCDRDVIEFIIAQFDPRDPAPVIEIGPGRGALTAPLLARLDSLTVIELDRDLVDLLRERFRDTALRIISADALKYDFRLPASGSRLRLVGNLPYNISTPLLFHLLAQMECVASMLFMLQHEVVERMCAAPGEAAYGRLSVMLQSCCLAEQLMVIGPESFNPPPKVKSAIVRLTPDPSLRERLLDTSRFEQIVRLAFSKRRKTLRNALRELDIPSLFEESGINPELRAECLSVADYISLANVYSNSVLNTKSVDKIVNRK